MKGIQLMRWIRRELERLKVEDEMIEAARRVQDNEP